MKRIILNRKRAGVLATVIAAVMLSAGCGGKYEEAARASISSNTNISRAQP
ncbi:MAG: hypothetical protein R3B51_03075 [Thermodesulfobacteriota bacterium]